jgi:cupin superfamily acireductone dioxygenase involved in methionine salvage
MNQLKILSVLIGATIFSIHLGAQSINFLYKDGTAATYKLTDIKKITFNQNELITELMDASVMTQDIKTIQRYNYTVGSTLSTKSINNSDSLNIKIFPNPAFNELNIHYKLNKKESARYTMYDLQGKLIIDQTQENQSVGLQQQTLDLTHIPSGIYLCRIESGNNSVTTKIIKL